MQSRQPPRREATHRRTKKEQNSDQGNETKRTGGGAPGNVSVAAAAIRDVFPHRLSPITTILTGLTDILEEKYNPV